MAATVPPARDGLKQEHRLLLETVEAINIHTGTPASAAEVRDRLSEEEAARLAEAYQSPLSRVLTRVLSGLGQRGFLDSVKRGRVRLFFVPGVIARGTDEETETPPRRRRVLALVDRAVRALNRPLKAHEVVAFAQQEGLTEEIPEEMIKRDLTNLLRTGELLRVGEVRGDGGGTNLYFPSDLDLDLHQDPVPPTWLEELAAVFDEEWEDRLTSRLESGRKPVPPSTGDIRARLKRQHPSHPKLEDPQIVVNGMAQLADSADPHVRRVRREDQRRLLWAPQGVPDEELDLGAAWASDSERVVEAVQRALKALNLPAVTVQDVKDETHLHPMLRPAGMQCEYQIMSDLAREELHSSDGTRAPRVQRRVVRAGLVEGTTYFTTPEAEGVEEYLELLRLRSEWPKLDVDERLRALSSCPLDCVRFGRARLIVMECEGIAKRAGAVAPRMPFESWAREVHEIAEEAGRSATGARKVAEELADLELPDRPRQAESGFTPDQLRRLIFPRYPLATEEMTAARLVPLFERQIRRIPNPRFERRFNSSAETATEFLFERIDTLAYAAYRWGDIEERLFANMAATTLGRLRDPRFLAPALTSERFGDRQIAVACLAFLGDPGGDLHRMMEDDQDPVVRNTAAWGAGYLQAVGAATGVPATDSNQAA